MSELAIDVTVTPEYRTEESSEAESRYVFSYTINVRNNSPHSVQLMARYWKITQGGVSIRKCAARVWWGNSR